MRPASDFTSGRVDHKPMKTGEQHGNGMVFFLCFQLSGHLYALPLDVVERALRMVAVTPVPDALPWQAGVIGLQGQVIPVMDLRARLGYRRRKPHPDDHLVVLHDHGRKTAVAVDQVTGVLEVPMGGVVPPPEDLSRSRFLSGLIQHEMGLILVLEADRLMESGPNLTTREQGNGPELASEELPLDGGANAAARRALCNQPHSAYHERRA